MTEKILFFALIFRLFLYFFEINYIIKPRSEKTRLESLGV